MGEDPCFQEVPHPKRHLQFRLAGPPVFVFELLLSGGDKRSRLECVALDFSGSSGGSRGLAIARL